MCIFPFRHKMGIILLPLAAFSLSMLKLINLINEKNHIARKNGQKKRNHTTKNRFLAYASVFFHIFTSISCECKTKIRITKRSIQDTDRKKRKLKCIDDPDFGCFDALLLDLHGGIPLNFPFVCYFSFAPKPTDFIN